jgi:hypothetical protein
MTPSLTTPVHPRCGKSYPGGDGAGHCATCCETFIGLGAFDRHLWRQEDGTYVHREPVENIGLWWKDARGYWHHGQRLTEEQRKELWPSDG